MKSRISMRLLVVMCMVLGCVVNVAAQKPLFRETVELTHNVKNGCYLGDTIRFTANVKREGHQGATDYSRVLYVELLNPYGVVVQRSKLPIDDGVASGSIVVDSILNSGFYELRAFTRYMTNWSDHRYFSDIVPVYLPEHRIGKSQQRNVRYINTRSSRFVEDDSRMAMRHLNFNDTIYGVTQPIESHLMVFGYIKPKFKKATEDDLRLGNRHLKVMITQGNKHYIGDAETDDRGYFALYFPDVNGEWNMMITSPKGENLRRHIIVLDCLFSPANRCYMMSEVTPDKFGMKKWHEDRSSDKQVGYFLDCDKTSTKLKNNGDVSLGFYKYLGRTDKNFVRTQGIASPTCLNVARDTTYNKYIDIDLLGKDSDDPRTVCVDGVAYGKRPIVWIVNGKYRLVTGLNKQITDFKVLRPTSQSMPLYVDEVKSVFVSLDPTAFLPYVRCSVLENKKPVTVYVTLHDNYRWDDSLLRSAVFEGFDF